MTKQTILGRTWLEAAVQQLLERENVSERARDRFEATGHAVVFTRKVAPVVVSGGMVGYLRGIMVPAGAGLVERIAAAQERGNYSEAAFLPYEGSQLQVAYVKPGEYLIKRQDGTADTVGIAKLNGILARLRVTA